MKKTLTTLFVLAGAGLIGAVHAAEGGTPSPAAATGQQQKAKNAEKKQVKKQEQKQIHKKDTSATPATPAVPAQPAKK